MAVEKDVFSRLKRLFSTDTIIRNVGGDQLKVLDVNKIQSYGNTKTNSLVDRFSRLHMSGISAASKVPSLNYQTLRTQLYSDYEAMDTDPIIASVLDIISDESTLRNENGEVLQIRSSDEATQKILYNLFYDILNIEFNLWTWIRNMCKYGDFFLKLDIAEKYGVYNVTPFTAYTIIREEGFDKDNPGAVRFKYDPNALAGSSSYPTNMTPDNVSFDNYEMAHFRLLADINFLPYGRSYVEPARKIFKQLTLMEDAMMIHRITRAPEKRVFYINVGTIPPNEVDAYMQKTISKMKKTPYIDPQTGQYNLKFNMQNMMEDFYIPMRGNDTSTKIDTTKGLEYNGIEDVNYLIGKMFAALKVPKAFMGYEKDLEGKSTLAAQDIRFARTIERIQRIILSELNKIALIHLYTQGYDGDQLTNFEISLTTPSIIYDQERIALLKSKIELARDMMDLKLFPTDHIYDKIFQLSEDQFSEFRDLIREDVKRSFRLSQIENEGNDPSETGASYGTPHDLASLYGKGRYGDNSNVPLDYDEKNDVGRPVEKSTVYNTQDDPLGKDRIGKVGMKSEPVDKSLTTNYKGGSPLAMEGANINYLKNKKMLDSMKTKKKLIFETKPSILDESNIKE